MRACGSGVSSGEYIRKSFSHQLFHSLLRVDFLNLTLHTFNHKHIHTYLKWPLDVSSTLLLSRPPLDAGSQFLPSQLPFVTFPPEWWTFTLQVKLEWWLTTCSCLKRNNAPMNTRLLKPPCSPLRKCTLPLQLTKFERPELLFRSGTAAIWKLYVHINELWNLK